VRVLARSMMCGAVWPRPSNVDIKDILHVGWRRVADVLSEAEFAHWPPQHTHRCLCRAEFSQSAAFVAHALACPLYRTHAPAEALERQWRVQHHVELTGRAPDHSFDSPLPVELLDSTAAADHRRHMRTMASHAPALATTFSGSAGSAASADSVRGQYDVSGHGDAALLLLDAVAPHPTLLDVELREAILLAASACDAALHAPADCFPLVDRPILAPPDELDPSGVTVAVAAAAAVMIRQRARAGETRREQLADAAREAARFNSELLEQRQRRGPFEVDQHTSTVQVLPAWPLAATAELLARHVGAQRELCGKLAAARDAQLDAHRHAESDVRRLVLDRRHASLTGAAAPRRPIDAAFDAADAELAAHPELRDFDPLAPVLPPVRNMSAWHLFAAEQRPLAQAANPYLTHQEVAKLVGQLWRNLDDAGRGVYEQLAAIDKARYDAAWAPFAVKEARAKRVRDAARIVLERDVEFAVGWLPPPDSVEAQQQQQRLQHVNAGAYRYVSAAALRVASGGGSGSSAARPSTLKGARGKRAHDAEDEDEFVPKPKGSRSSTGARRGRRRFGDDDEDDDDDDDDDDDEEESFGGGGDDADERADEQEDVAADDADDFRPSSKRKRERTVRLSFAN
jgi:hypothetical protein